jgi:HEAT repeat protein
MGRSCDKRWKTIVIEELGNQSPAMRYEAAWACGEMGLREAVPALARTISDPDRQVCNAAIWALGQIGGTQARQILDNAYHVIDPDLHAALDDALAEAVLAEGGLDMLLYEYADVEDKPLEDEFVDLWTAQNDDADDDWELDDLS